MRKITMRKITEALFKAVSTFGTICIGCGITLMIEYGLDTTTVGLTVGAVLISVLYRLAPFALDFGDEYIGDEE